MNWFKFDKFRAYSCFSLIILLLDPVLLDTLALPCLYYVRVYICVCV